MEKIYKLTEEQFQKVNEYRERFFGFATSTKPGNKALASQAAVRLAELAGLINCDVKFISNPKEGDSLCESDRASLRVLLRNSISGSIRRSIRYSLWNSLWNSIRGSIRNSIRGSIRELISESTWNSFYDSGWTAFYSFVVEELGVECTDKDREILSLHRVIAENCSAVWIIPGAIIICDKPSFVEVEDGNLISVEWV